MMPVRSAGMHIEYRLGSAVFAYDIQYIRGKCSVQLQEYGPPAGAGSQL